MLVIDYQRLKFGCISNICIDRYAFNERSDSILSRLREIMSTDRRRKYRYLTDSCEHRGLVVNNKDNNLLIERLDALNSLVATAMGDHNSLLFYRFDLRLPQGLDVCTSDITNRFIGKLKKRWDSSKRGKLHYIWCKERESAKGDHWHFGFVVDSKFTQPLGLAEMVDKSWCYAVQPQNYKRGLVERVGYEPNVSKHTGHIKIAEIVYWWSYLCKHRQGTEVSRGNFRTSRVNKDLKLELNLTEEQKEEAVQNNKKLIRRRHARTMKKKKEFTTFNGSK
mgnify:CR=1 FL=1